MCLCLHLNLPTIWGIPHPSADYKIQIRYPCKNCIIRWIWRWVFLGIILKIISLPGIKPIPVRKLVYKNLPMFPPPWRNFRKWRLRLWFIKYLSYLRLRLIFKLLTNSGRKLVRLKRISSLSCQPLKVVSLVLKK